MLKDAISGILFGIGIMGLLALVILMPHTNNCGEADHKVVKVGGCTAEGHCAVRFDDGTKGYMTLPVEGSTPVDGCEVHRDPNY